MEENTNRYEQIYHMCEAENAFENVDSNGRKNVELGIEQCMQDNILEFTLNLCDILHADSQQTNDGAIKVEWHTVKNKIPIAAIFKLSGHDANYNAIVRMEIFGRSQGVISRLSTMNLSMDSTGTVTIIGGLYKPFKKLEHLRFLLNKIDATVFDEIRSIMFLIEFTDGKLYFTPTHINQQICRDETLFHLSPKHFVIECCSLFGITCCHPEVFRNLDDKTRDKMIKICMDANREDCADILRRNK